MNLFSIFKRTGDGGKSEIVTGSQAYGPAYSSSSVGFDSAMQISAFWASARILTESVAAMPLKCYRLEGGRRVEYSDHPIYRLLSRNPNRYQTKTEFFESLMLNLVTSGNAYFLIQRSGRRVIGLLPMPATQVEPYLMDGGDIYYKFTDLNRRETAYKSDQIWHIKIFGNGITGLSPLKFAANSLGMAISQDVRASKVSKNGGKVAGYIKTPDAVKLDQETRAAIRAQLKDMVAGNDDFLPVLEMGAEFRPVGLSPADVSLLESRRFSVEDIARFMGVPSVLINDTAGSTVWGSGIGQLVEGFYKLNLRPYLERIETSMRRHLLDASEFEAVEFEFDFDSLLRADKKGRIDAMSAAINSGQLTPNEARADEGRPPVAGGDSLLINSTLIDISKPREVVQ